MVSGARNLLQWICAVLLISGGATGAWALGEDVSCPPEALGRKTALVVGASRPGGEADAASDQVRAVLEGRLFQLPFQLVDQAALDAMLPEKQKQLLLAGDAVAAATLKEKLGAELVLTVALSSRVQSMGSFGTNMQTVYLQTGLKLLDAASAKILATQASSTKGAGLDPVGVIVGMVEKNADDLVAGIFRQYCRRAPQVFSAKPEAQSSLPPEGAGEGPDIEEPPSGAGGPPPQQPRQPASGGSVEDL